MNSTLNEPREHANAGPQRGELAVLFHLVDVSRPRPAPRPDQLATLPLDHSLQLRGATSTVLQTTLPTTFSFQGTEQPPPAMGEMPPPKIDKVAPAVFEATAPQYALAASEPAVTAPAAAADQKPAAPIEAEAVSTPEPAKQQPEAPANLPASRRQSRTRPSEDWFATHGKYIAIGFVLALIGTVYAARSHRKQAESTQAMGTTSSPWQTKSHEHPTSDSVATGPSKVQAIGVSAVSDSRVELHAPITAPLAEVSTDSKAITADKLFEFPVPKKSEERVASRPEGPKTNETNSPSEKAASVNASEPTTTSPQSNLGPSLHPSQSGTPSQTASATIVQSMPTSYPLTSSPPLVGPAATNSASLAPAGYAGPAQPPPGTERDYRSQYPVQTGPYPSPPQQVQSPAQAWAPPGPSPSPYQAGPYQPGSYQPGSYQPAANQPVQTARGPRNERIGSGNY